MITYKKYYLSILIAFIITSINAFAQKPKLENLPKYDYQKIHFGFSLGFDEMNFIVKHIKNIESLDSVYRIEPTPAKGFTIGLISNLRLHNHWDLRFIPDLAFGQRTIEYSIKENNKIINTYKKNIESTYVNFPIIIKYKSARVNNFRAYILGGARYCIDLASQAGKKDTDEEYVKIKKWNYATDLGVGFDFYMYYFKFSIELKMSYGLNNMLSKDNTVFTKSIDRLSSKIFYLTFNFE
mgnify:CR=1 FL=1